MASPDGRNEVTVEIRQGRLHYSLRRDGRSVVVPSLLGFELRGARPLRDSLRIVDTARASVDQTWTQVWSEVARVRDPRLTLALAAGGGQAIRIRPAR